MAIHCYLKEDERIIRIANPFLDKEDLMTFNELQTHIKEVGERIINLRGYL